MSAKNCKHRWVLKVFPKKFTYLKCLICGLITDFVRFRDEDDKDTSI